jgi:predicted nucleic acid-binding protein
MLTRFVDTGGWAAWINPRDVHHQKAVELINEVWQAEGRLVTTNLVLIELSALMIRMKIAKSTQVDLIQEVYLDPSIEVTFIDAVREASAWTLWKSRLDKDWTMVDCSSFILMEEYQLVDALTPDHHFQQAGFNRLL